MRPGTVPVPPRGHPGHGHDDRDSSPRQICATDAASSVVGRSAKPVMTRDQCWRRLARCAMMRPMRNMWRLAAVVAAAALAATTACAPISNKTATGTPDKCTKDVLGTLYPGIFTFGTDQPVYPPWYMGDNPANGEGFEAAIAYAVAAKMDYARDDVRWVRVPFNAALAPGPKTFDANLSEFSITEQRKAAVDFSSPYFDVTQAVVTVKSSPAAGVKTLQTAEKPLRLGCPGGHHQLHRGDVGGRRRPGRGVQHQRRRQDGAEQRRDRCAGGRPANRFRGCQRAARRADGRPIAQCGRRCRAVRHRARQGQSADPLRIMGRRYASRGRHAGRVGATVARRCGQGARAG